MVFPKKEIKVGCLRTDANALPLLPSQWVSRSCNDDEGKRGHCRGPSWWGSWALALLTRSRGRPEAWFEAGEKGAWWRHEQAHRVRGGRHWPWTRQRRGTSSKKEEEGVLLHGLTRMRGDENERGDRMEKRISPDGQTMAAVPEITCHIDCQSSRGSLLDAESTVGAAKMTVSQ